MSAPATQTTNLAATGVAIPDGDARIVGIFVTTSSSLTLKLWDNTAASGTVILPTTAAITAPAYFPFEATVKNGCFCTFGGTGTVTICWKRA